MRTTKKLFFGTLFSFALMLTMMLVLGLSQMAYADDVETYPVWVGGVQVTSENASDVLADDPNNKGKVSFTPAKDETPATLTLNGAVINGEASLEYREFYHTYNIYSEDIDLTIVLEGKNIVDSGENPAEYAIFSRCFGTKLKIKGPGTLTANGRENAVFSFNDCQIENCGITASSIDGYAISSNKKCEINDCQISATSDKSTGIDACEGDITITGSTVTAAGGEYGIDSWENVIVDSCKLEAVGGSRAGLYGKKGVTISGGTVTAAANGVNGKGIYSYSGDVTISGGTVTATATGDNGNGINAKSGAAVINDGSKVTAVGGKLGIFGAVKNAIPGTGWTDMAGTKGKTVIAEGEHESDELKDFKRVQFEVDPVKQAIALIEALPADPAKASKADAEKAFAAYRALTKAQRASLTDKAKKIVAAYKYYYEARYAKAQKTKLKSVKARKGKKALVKWKTVPGVSGYQICYKTKGKKVRKVNVSSAKAVKKTVKKLKAGKKYTFKVRTFTRVYNPKTGKNKKIYGKWSNKMKIRVR